MIFYTKPSDLLKNFQVLFHKHLLLLYQDFDKNKKKFIMFDDSFPQIELFMLTTFYTRIKILSRILKIFLDSRGYER